MSTEARRAPVPPRPTGPPPPSGFPNAQPPSRPHADPTRDTGPAPATHDGDGDRTAPGTEAGPPPRPPATKPTRPPETRTTEPPTGPPGATPATPPGGTSGRSSGGEPAIPPRPAGPPPRRTAPRLTAPRSTVPPDEDTARLRPVPPAPPAGTAPPRPTRSPAPPPPTAPTFASTGISTRLPPPPPGYEVARDAPLRPDGPPAPAHRGPGPAHLTRTPPGGPPTAPPPYRRPAGPPEAPAGTSARLLPVPARHPGRTAAAIACVVLGLGLIGGAVTGSYLTGDSSADAASGGGYAPLRTLWHSTPVDTFFPSTLKGDGAGPGGADRTWTRVAVSPDTRCADALDPLLLKTLRPVGCERVLRATYADATSSTVTTVGLVFTEGEPSAMEALGTRFTDEKLTQRTDLMPRTYPVKGTVAAGFGDGQRASWTVNVLTEAPVVVYAVSGFADGRRIPDPQPVAKATADGAKTAAAQSGLGHDAKGIADRVERGLRTTVSMATEKPR